MIIKLENKIKKKFLNCTREPSGFLCDSHCILGDSVLSFISMFAPFSSTERSMDFLQNTMKKNKRIGKESGNKTKRKKQEKDRSGRKRNKNKGKI